MQQQQQQQQQQGAAGLPLPPARAPSRLQRGNSMPLQPAAAAEPLSAAVSAVPLRRPPQQQLDEQLDWDDGIPPFLDAVRLRLVGCSQAEAQEGLQLVRHSAAKRFSDWRSDINHVVVRQGFISCLLALYCCLVLLSRAVLSRAVLS
jgi:hypothetical protein